MYRASEFRLVLALKIIQNTGWKNGHLTAFAEVALTNNMVVESESYGHLEFLGFKRWEDLYDIDKKKLGILIVETHEYLGDMEQALDGLKSLCKDHPKDEELRKRLKTFEKAMQTLRGANPGEEIKTSTGS